MRSIAIIALVAVIGFSFAACSGDDSGGAAGGDGYFTLTDIPKEYDGKYAVLFAYNEDVDLIGAKEVNYTAKKITLCQISNGSVSLPMWIENGDGHSVEKYSGNDEVKVAIEIFNSASYTKSSDPLCYLYFEYIAFAKGGAKKSWSEGDLEKE